MHVSPTVVTPPIACPNAAIRNGAEVSEVCNVRLRFESQVLTLPFKIARRLRSDSCPSRGGDPREGSTVDDCHHRLDFPLPFPLEPLPLPWRVAGVPRSGAVHELGVAQTEGGCKQREHW